MSRSALRPLTKRRLHHQIQRALNHTYAAGTGLRLLVGQSTREMLTDGASREQIRQALADCVRGHTTPIVDDASTQRTGEGPSEVLVSSMLEWADQVCQSVSNRRAAGS